MTVATSDSIIPIELKLESAKRSNAQGFAKLGLSVVLLLKWLWWHTKSYGPIVAILVLSLGSLLVLNLHWLYRKLAHLPASEKQVLKDVG
jgi:hypothetical protein